MTTAVSSVLLLAALGAAPLPASSRSSRPEGAALVVGIESYPTDADVSGAADDARLFAQFAHTTLGIPEGRIVLLTDEEASRYALSGAFDELLSRAGPKASLWLYLAGRVGRSARGEAALLGAQAPVNTEAGFPLRELLKRLAQVQAAERVVILDGQWTEGVAPPAAPPGVALLLSPSDGRPRGEIADRGAFTWHVLNGLRGAADVDGDDEITLGELAAYVRRKLGPDVGAPLLALGGLGARVAVLGPRPADALATPPLVVREESGTEELGSLTVDSTRPGHIYLDGADTGLVSPATLDNLTPGHYKVEVRGTDGRGEEWASVEAGDRAAVHVALNAAARTSLFHVATVPDGAEVSIDGASYGHAPFAVRLEDGEHELHAELSGFQTYNHAFQVDELTTEQTFTLSPLDGSLVWSLLFPLVEYDGRYSGNVWFGGRIVAGFLTFDLGNSGVNGIYGGLAGLAHYRLEDPATTLLGLDVYGGPTLEYASYTPNTRTSTFGGHNDALYGAVAGVAVRVGYLQLMAELHMGLVGGEVHLFFCPTLAIRNDR